MNDQHTEILLEVGALPTGPFVENAVNSYIRRFVDSRGRLRLQADRWGNLMVSYASGRPVSRGCPPPTASRAVPGPGSRPGPGRRGPAGPLWLTAHTDHPGFVAERMTAPNRLLARWFGGVALPFFKQADVRFYVMSCQPAAAQVRPCHVERIVPGRITRVVTATTNGEARPQLRKRVQSVYVEVAEPVPPGTVGMWRLPDPRIAGTQVLARAHDDLAQVAALLCLLDDLDRNRPAGQVTCAFTRAEEVGFIGAIGLARDRTVPANATFISLECSDALSAGVNQGDGPILRVGDLVTTFDQATLAWMNEVAKDLAALAASRPVPGPGPGRRSAAAKGPRAKTESSDPGFRYQRKLMPGGTCESTALAVYGYTTGALCLPLLNYHNMGQPGQPGQPGQQPGPSAQPLERPGPPGSARIESEIIDLRDFHNELAWLSALVAQSARRADTNKRIAAKLDKRFADNRPLLRKWAK